ncbi:hypothetical protein D9M71_677000 [compost metagenome]
MPGAEQKAQGMGYNQPDKTDGADNGHHHSRHQRCTTDQQQLGAPHRDAQRGGRIGTEGKGIQRTAMPQAHQQAENRHRYGQPHRRPAYTAQVAQQPEQDAARLLGGG